MPADPPRTAPAAPWRAALLFLPGRSLFNVFRIDRPLAIAFAVLTVCAWVPMLVTPYLPLVDLAGNVGSASLLIDAAFGHGTVAHFLRVQWQPIPYWTAYVIMAVVSALAGPFTSAKVMVGILNVLLPLSTMRLAVAMGRSPRVALWAFCLSWDHNLYWGWVTFLLGMCFALIALAKLIEARTLGDALRIVPLTALIALSHVQAVALIGLVGGLYALMGRPFWPRFSRSVVALAGTGVAILPWVIRMFTPLSDTGSSAKLTMEIPTAWEKMPLLYANSLDNVVSRWGQWVHSLAFVLLLFGPLLLAALPRLSTPREDGAHPAILLIVNILLYLAAPMFISGAIIHWHTYPRFATFILLSMLLVPRPALHEAKNALALVPGVVAALAIDAAVTSQFRDFSVKARPLMDILPYVKPDTKVITLEFEDLDVTAAAESGRRDNMFDQVHCYITAAKHAYDPHLFDNASVPLLYRPEVRLPSLGWHQASHFTMEGYGKYYDYILVQGLSQDPVKVGPGPDGLKVSLLKESGMWRLYGVEPNHG